MSKNIILTAFLMHILVIGYAGNNPEMQKIHKRIDKILAFENLELSKLEHTPGKDPAGEFYKVISNNSDAGYLYLGNIYTCGPNGCENPAVSGTTEYFRFFLIMDINLKILHIEVLEYAATHGQEVCSQGWLRQFKGLTPGLYIVYEKDIDAISGATKSAENLTSEINFILQDLAANQKL